VIETAQSVVSRLLEDENADDIKREALASGEGVDIRNLDEFTRAYIDAMFFTEDDQLRADSGNDSLGYDDISGRLAFQIHEECRKFQEDNANDLANSDLEKAGTDFWFTRNGHGTGFWDSDYWRPGERKRLTASSKKFGNMEVYVGDDGKIYGS